MEKKITRNQLVHLSLIAWAVIAAVHFIILRWQFGLNADVAMADSLIFSLLFALPLSGIWFMVVNSSVSSRFKFIFQTVASALVLTLAWGFTSRYILSAIFTDDPQYTAFLSSSLFMRMLLGFVIYLMTYAIFYLITLTRKDASRLQRETELTALLKETEMKALRSQINPHFLFNTLNSLNSLILTDAAKASEMVVMLSDYFRYSLKNQKNDQVTLDEELENIRRYLRVEQIRFRNKLKVDVPPHDQAKDCRVPAMILQPLVENAVKHGVYENLSESLITITVLSDTDYCQVTVANTKEETNAEIRGTGTGLQNVKERLKLIYGISDLMTIKNETGYFSVTLKFPQYG